MAHMRLTRPILPVAALAAFLGARALPAAAECGVASWYGHGGATASGEEFDVEAMTAAHRTLPFGTVVLVENLRNGRDVTVRINDRGPFVKGRIVDLSFAAALALDLTRSGIAPVRVTVLGAPDAASTGCG